MLTLFFCSIRMVLLIPLVLLFLWVHKYIESLNFYFWTNSQLNCQMRKHAIFTLIISSTCYTISNKLSILTFTKKLATFIWFYLIFEKSIWNDSIKYIAYIITVFKSSSALWNDVHIIKLFKNMKIVWHETKYSMKSTNFFWTRIISIFGPKIPIMDQLPILRANHQNQAIKRKSLFLMFQRKKQNKKKA